MRLRVLVLAALGFALVAGLGSAEAGVHNEHWRKPHNWPFRPAPGLRRNVSGLPAFWSDGSSCATGCRPGGAHFGWPLKPFHRQHPLRAGLNEMRPSSFHVGIDIQSPDSRKVYALQSGRAHVIESSGAEERVQVGSYIYWHVNLRVGEGASVRAFSTVLGTVKKGFGHLHLSEVRGGRYLNPLRPHGRVLFPWRDREAPILARPRFLSDGRVLLDAFDPQTFREFTTYNTPVLAPAALAYRVLDRKGHGLTRLYWALRGTQNYDWSAHSLVFASDTRPPYFWCWIRNPDCKPRWDYVLAGGLAPSLRSLRLRSGRRYVLAAYAWDWAGNASTIRATFHAPRRSAARKAAAPEPRVSRVRPSDEG
jgi:hypothetical protein